MSEVRQIGRAQDAYCQSESSDFPSRIQDHTVTRTIHSRNQRLLVSLGSRRGHTVRSKRLEPFVHLGAEWTFQTDGDAFLTFNRTTSIITTSAGLPSTCVDWRRATSADTTRMSRTQSPSLR
jgi:hypothetical protein